METHLNASKPALGGMKMEKETVISNHGSVAPLAQLLLGSNHVVEMIIATTTTVMGMLHHHGLHVVEATTREATNRMVTVVLLAVGPHHGNDSRTTHPHHLLRAADMEAMVVIQGPTEMSVAATAPNRAWVLHQDWVAVLVVLVLLQV